MKEKLNVYIAGPFFNDIERKRMQRLKDYLTKFTEEYNFFFPIDLIIPDADKLPNSIWAKTIFESDKKEIDKAHLMIAIYDKQYSDSGTAWELGYAHGVGLPVILLCTDLNNYNSIMTLCAADFIYDFEGFLNGNCAIDFKDLNNLK